MRGMHASGALSDDFQERWEHWTGFLFPNSADGPKFLLSRWLFLRLLGVVYLVAFWSLATQIIGLSGEQLNLVLKTMAVVRNRLERTGR